MELKKAFSAVVAIWALGAACANAQNVGIGLAAPLDKLHVAGNVRVDGLAAPGTRMVGANVNGTLVAIAAGANGQVLTQTAGGPAWQTSVTNWTIVGNAGTVASTNFIGTTDAIDFVVRTNDTEQMRITTAGDAGIGLPNPSGKLHVNGDVRVGFLFPPNTGTLPSYGSRILFSGGNTGASYNSDNSDPIWLARYNASSDQSELRLNLSDNCSTVDAFVIQTGGSGCGANSVYFRFDGVGDAYRPGGGSWLALSDQRLKRNIQAFDDGLAALNAVRPVTFEYNGVANTPDNGTRYVGVIAQELQSVAPYMVKQNGEYLTVDPSAFTYLLINAVQEQQRQIETLQQRDASRQLEINQLRADLEQVKSSIQK